MIAEAHDQVVCADLDLGCHVSHEQAQKAEAGDDHNGLARVFAEMAGVAGQDRIAVAHTAGVDADPVVGDVTVAGDERPLPEDRRRSGPSRRDHPG